MVLAGCAGDGDDSPAGADATSTPVGDESETSVGTSVGGGADTGESTGESTGEQEVPIPLCDTDVTDQLTRLRVPGVSAGIIRDGRLACIAVAGMANIEEGRPVTPDTVFTWASVSKTITGTAAMILFDDGEFGLDDDIDKFLPYSVRNPNCPADPVTFRQLLTHTSSIADHEQVYDDSYTDGDSPIALGDFVHDYLVPGGDYYDAEENFDSGCPGDVNEYSNVAIGLLGHLVEQIAGVPFDDFCRERIFAPLGMEPTSFHLANLDLSGVAMPYDGRSMATFTAHGHFGFPTFPDGLLRASVPHLARFLAMSAELGEYDGTRILAEDTAREMRRLQIPDLDDTQGLAWYYDFDGAFLGHDGGDPGTSSMMFFDPSNGTGALLVANGDWYNANDNAPEATSLLETLLEEAARE